MIPCSVILESSQSQLLDLLCAPEAIPLCLQRNVQYTCKAAPTQVQAFANGTGQNHQTTNIGSAVWWRSPSQPGTPYARHMEGEIRLPKDLNPSSSVGHFDLSVSLFISVEITTLLTLLLSVQCHPRFIEHPRFFYRLLGVQFLPACRDHDKICPWASPSGLLPARLR